MPAFLTLQSLSASAPDGTALFRDLNLTCHNERTGLVGPNGVGKSTLFRIIMGEIAPVSGTLARSGMIGCLRQNWPDLSISIAEALGVAPQLALLDRIEAGQGDEQDFEQADWFLPDRLSKCLEQVGLGHLGQDNKLGCLSGGQRTRVAIADMLLKAPDLLLLDEPTNNLDREGRALVMELVCSWPGGVIIASHDRQLLRRADRILALSNAGCILFGGGWDAYHEAERVRQDRLETELERSERDVRKARQQIQQQRERKAQRDKMGRAQRKKGAQPKMLLDAQADRADRTSARDKKLEQRLQQASEQARELAASRLEVRSPIGIDAVSASSHGEIVRLESLILSRGSCRLGPFSLCIRAKERIALLGENGAGKSSLLAAIMGRLQPAVGKVILSGRIAMLDQQVEAFDNDLSLLANLQKLHPSLTEREAHAILARYAFRNVAAEKKVANLSGGERLRAGLAATLSGNFPPDLIILDEPTNHLDLETIAILEQALSIYRGAMIVASHDPDFLAAIGITRHWSLHGGLVQEDEEKGGGNI